MGRATGGRRRPPSPGDGRPGACGTSKRTGGRHPVLFAILAGRAAASGCRTKRPDDPRRNDAVAVDTRDRIRQFIKEEILFENQDAAIADDTPLLSGIIDSLGLTQMVAFIEDE